MTKKDEQTMSLDLEGDGKPEDAPAKRKPSPEKPAKKAAEEAPVYLLSSNFALPFLFAAGRMAPPVLMGKPTGDAFFDGENRDRLLWRKDDLPADWSDGVRAGRNRYPVALRLAAPPRQYSMPGGATFEAILASDVSALVFANEKERDKFLRLQYDDSDVSDFDFPNEIDPEIFAGSPADRASDDSEDVNAKLKDSDAAKPDRLDSVGLVDSGAEPTAEDSPESDTSMDSKDAAEPSNSPEPEAVERSAKADTPKEDWPPMPAELRVADAMAGLQSFLLAKAPGEEHWMTALVAIDAARGEKDPLGPIAEKLGCAVSVGADKGTAAELEASILCAALTVLLDYPQSAGWPASEVLGAIAGRASEASPKLEAGIRAWEENCGHFLDAEKALSPKQFQDDRNRVQRAVMLLLLRDGKISSLAKTPQGRQDRSAIAAGPVVWTLAATLAAFRTGLAALSVSEKIGGDRMIAPEWLSFLAESGLRMLGSPDPAAPGASALRLEYASGKPLEGTWDVQAGDLGLAVVERDFDPDLRKVLADGQRLGYRFEQDGDAGLRTEFRFEDGRSQTVFLSIDHVSTVRGDKAKPFVRFVSCAESIQSKRKLPKPYVDWAFGRIKARAGALLALNMKLGQSCHFGLSEEHQGLVVVASQCIENMDTDEFEHHLEHVAHTADEYERSLGRDDH